MAEGDNRARYTDGSPDINRLIGGGVVKANPTAMHRLPEDGNTDGRSAYYAAAGQKDRLPEHTERRDTYPLITAANA